MEITLAKARKLSIQELFKANANAHQLDDKSITNIHTAIVEKKQSSDLPNADIIIGSPEEIQEIQKFYKGVKIVLFNNGDDKMHLLVEDEYEAKRAAKEKKSVYPSKSKETKVETTKEKPAMATKKQAKQEPITREALEAAKADYMNSLGKNSPKKEIKSVVEPKKEEKKPTKSTKKPIIVTPINDENLEEVVEKPAKKSKVVEVAEEPKSGVGNTGLKYKKTGTREETMKIGKKLVKKGDTVYFILKGEIMSGIFTHVNKNIHSPNGYAVIRYGDSKLIERTLNKVFLTKDEAK